MLFLEEELPLVAANLHFLLCNRLYEEALKFIRKHFKLQLTTAADVAAETNNTGNSRIKAAVAFYESLCLMLAGHLHESIGHFNRLLDDVDYALPASMCLQHIYRDLQGGTSAVSVLVQCHARVAQNEKTASALGTFYATVAALYMNADVGGGGERVATKLAKKLTTAMPSGLAAKWLRAHVLLYENADDDYDNDGKMEGEMGGDDDDGLIKNDDDENVMNKNSDNFSFGSEKIDEAARFFQDCITKLQQQQQQQQQQAPQSSVVVGEIEDPLKPTTATTNINSNNNSRNNVGSGRHLLASIGLCECYARRNDSKRLSDMISRIQRDTDNLNENLLLQQLLISLKVRAALLNYDWQLALELVATTASTATTAAAEKNFETSIENNPLTEKSVFGELVITLSKLCHNNNNSNGLDDFQHSVSRLFSTVRAREPRNVRVRVWLVRLLSRLLPPPPASSSAAATTPELTEQTKSFLCELLSASTTDIGRCEASVWQLFELVNQCTLVRDTDNAVVVVKEIMRRLQRVGSEKGRDEDDFSDEHHEDNEDIINTITIMAYTEIFLRAAEHDDDSSTRSRYVTDAETQYKFLENLMQSSTSPAVVRLAKSPRYLFLQVRMLMLLNNKTDKSQQSAAEATLPMLNKAAHKHMNTLRHIPFGIDFLQALDARLIIGMIQTMLSVAGVDNNNINSKNTSKKSRYLDAVVEQAENLFQQISKALPGITDAGGGEGNVNDNEDESVVQTTRSDGGGLSSLLPDIQFMMARVLLLRGGGSGSAKNQQQTQALSLLRRVVRQHPKFEVACLLLARIECQNKMYKQAQATLEAALAHNFALPQQPEYWILMAETCFGLKNQAVAQSSISRAAALLDRASSSINKTANFELLLELLDLSTRCNDELLARKLLTKAQNLLPKKDDDDDGENENERGIISASAVQPHWRDALVLAEARLLIMSDSSRQADEILQLLKTLDAGSIYHQQSLELMGNILLDVKHDEKRFIELYQHEFRTRLAAASQKQPSRDETAAAALTEAHIQLSNAYMRIPAPERALQTLEAAVERDPKNTLLITQLGMLYTRCHYYKKAVNYYELAVKKGNYALLPEFVQLLIDMDNYERAGRVCDEFHERVFGNSRAKQQHGTGDGDDVEETVSGDAAAAFEAGGVKKEKKQISIELHLISAELWSLQSVICKIESKQDWSAAKECLVNSKTTLAYALERASRERPDLEPQITNNFINVCCTLCEQYLLLEHQFAEAKALYEEAMSVSKTVTSSSASTQAAETRVCLGMTRALLGLREITQAQRVLNNISSSSDARALALAAEINFLRHDSSTSTGAAQQNSTSTMINKIFSFAPPAAPRMPNASTIANLINLLFRTSNNVASTLATTLRALDGLLQRYRQHGTSEESGDAGFTYCRALLQRLAGNDTAALQLLKPLLSLQKGDDTKKSDGTDTAQQWVCAQAAVQTMFCILNWQTYIPSVNPSLIINQQLQQEPPPNAVLLSKNDVTVLRQMFQKAVSPELISLNPTYAVYSLLPLLYYSSNSTVKDNSTKIFTEVYHTASAMRERWPKSVAPIWAVATSLRLLGREREACTVLKPTLSMAWNLEESDLLERCWIMLLLSGNGSSGGDAVNAVALLEKCLRYNQASYFANLLMAQYIEQRNSTSGSNVNEQAIDRYETAFRVSAGTDRVSGVKLVETALASGNAYRALGALLPLMQSVEAQQQQQQQGSATTKETSDGFNAHHRELLRSCVDMFRT